MKLSGAPKVEQLNMEEFEKQAKEYEEEGSFADNVFKILNLLWMTHPFPVQRVVEARKWFASEEFKNILAGNYQLRGDDPPSHIKEDIQAAAKSYKENFDDFITEVSNIKDGIANVFFGKKQG